MKKITLYILWTAKRESTPDDQNNLIIPGSDAIKRSVQAYPGKLGLKLHQIFLV